MQLQEVLLVTRGLSQSSMASNMGAALSVAVPVSSLPPGLLVTSTQRLFNSGWRLLALRHEIQAACVFAMSRRATLHVGPRRCSASHAALALRGDGSSRWLQLCAYSLQPAMLGAGTATILAALLFALGTALLRIAWRWV